MMFGELTIEQGAMLETIDRIALEFDRHYWQRCREANRFPVELWQALAGAGVLGVAVPEDYGGVGLGLLEMALVQERLAARGIPLLLLVVGPGLSFMPIVHHGTTAQKARYLIPAVKGEHVICFGITEAHAGSNTFAIGTFATPAKGGYRLNGHKTFISGAAHADQMLVVCRTAPGRREGLSLMMVDLKSRGITIRPQMMEVAALDGQCDVYFDDVWVPQDAVIGVQGHGFDYLFEGLNAERVNVAAMAVGLGRSAINKAVRYASSRKVFDDIPVGAYQGLQHPMAQASTHLELAWLMTEKASIEYDRGRAAGTFANMAKLAAVDAALEACDVAIEVHGGNGFTRDYDLLSGWSLCRLLKTAPVSRELILNYIGTHVLGLPPSH